MFFLFMYIFTLYYATYVYNNTCKNDLKGHMETYCNKSFLKYTHIQKKSNWSHQVMGETKPQVNILHYQIKSLVLGMGYIWVTSN